MIQTTFTTFVPLPAQGQRRVDVAVHVYGPTISLSNQNSSDTVVSHSMSWQDTEDVEQLSILFQDETVRVLKGVALLLAQARGAL